jgi:hypothetical protein
LGQNSDTFIYSGSSIPEWKKAENPVDEPGGGPLRGWTYGRWLKNQDTDGIEISCCVFLLKKPQGAFLITAAPERNHLSVTRRPSFGKHCVE